MDGSPGGAPVWAAPKLSGLCQFMKNVAEGSLARFPAVSLQEHPSPGYF